MFVNVAVSFKKCGNVNQDFQEGVTVPKSAIVENGQLNRSVHRKFTKYRSSTMGEKLVKLIGDQVKFYQVLNAKDQYIISAQGKLFNGAKVTLK